MFQTPILHKYSPVFSAYFIFPFQFSPEFVLFNLIKGSFNKWPRFIHRYGTH